MASFDRKSFMNPDGLYQPTIEPIQYMPAFPLDEGALNNNTIQGFSQMPGGFLGSGQSGLMGFLGSDGFKTGVGALKTMAGLYNAYNTNKMAKQQLRFSRNFANANLANQTQSYNTALADRARSRGVVEGQSQGQVDNYVANNRLKDRTV